MTTAEKIALIYLAHGALNFALAYAGAHTDNKYVAGLFRVSRALGLDPYSAFAHISDMVKP